MRKVKFKITYIFFFIWLVVEIAGLVFDFSREAAIISLEDESFSNYIFFYSMVSHTGTFTLHAMFCGVLYDMHEHRRKFATVSLIIIFICWLLCIWRIYVSIGIINDFSLGFVTAVSFLTQFLGVINLILVPFTKRKTISDDKDNIDNFFTRE